MKKKLFLIIIFLIFCSTFAWARLVSTKGLQIKEYAYLNVSLPEQFIGKKIIHFSDLHYGSTIFEKELNDLVNTINKQKPDLIIFTGDLIDKDYKMSEKDDQIVIKALKKLEAKIGKYAVKGNHDYDYKNFDSVIEQTNFILLKNNYEFIYFENNNPIVIAGLPSILRDKQDYNQTFLFTEDETKYFTIVIAHEPDTLSAIRKYDIDLMLSGHSHGGQVRLPFINAIITPKGAKKYYEEQYQIDETKLYISSGIGTSALKIRFFNKPSINLFRLYNK